MATAPYSTLLAIAGRQIGHVQLIHLPPCPLPQPRNPPPDVPPSRPPPPPSKHPVSIIVAHKTALSTLTLPPSGRLLATTSSRGTLIRIWDSLSGKLVKELRRGTDKAEIYGASFRPDEQDLCVWSDKGTVHVFSLGLAGASNRHSSFSPLTPFLPLPRYFDSEWSYAQYRIPVQSAHISLSSTSKSAGVDEPEEEKCVVTWVNVATQDENSSRGPVPEYQLIALTFTGGWYRLALPPLRSTTRDNSPASLFKATMKLSPSKHGKGSSRSSEKGKSTEETEKHSRDCKLVEYKKYGRWDGWG